MPDAETLKIHAADAPQCPEHLQGEARRLWEAIAPQLAENGTLAPAVGTSLEIACQAYADWRLHTTRVAEQGPLVKSPNGFAVQHPSIGVAKSAAETWRKFVRQYRLDRPAAKTGTESKLALLKRKAAQQ